MNEDEATEASKPVNYIEKQLEELRGRLHAVQFMRIIDGDLAEQMTVYEMKRGSRR